jgi:hypothetical protein
VPACLILFASRAAPALGAGGSIAKGAPSFTLFGAFFPAWMFCALIGIIGAIAARAAMVSSGLAKILPFQLFVCTSIGLIVGLLAWLIWFGQ